MLRILHGQSHQMSQPVNSIYTGPRAFSTEKIPILDWVGYSMKPYQYRPKRVKHPPILDWVGCSKELLPVPPEEENLFDSSSGLSASSLYPRCLKPREFRLIWLEPPERPDYPVHLTLETYNRDHCPDYEATYLWGGEDGDYSPSEPVYIGPHWDILFQTKICWSMLKYLRPWRGIRTVWIDAICINQGDLKEREDQVEAMCETYQRSMRLVVYLGDDVVQKRDQYSYPMRCGLEEIRKTQVDLYQLFQRRYFSRVWVIQVLNTTQ
ncbi:Heterokaryon incompatibility protein (HET) domain containing protein [Rhypophila sp. PSN 637]